MPIVRSRPGILLVGQKLKPVAWNSEAFQILAFCNTDHRDKRLPGSPGELMMSRLTVNGPGSMLQLVDQVQSGKRKYVCRAFQLDAQGVGSESMSVVILKRPPVADMTLRRKLKEFHLTEREMQVAELLVQGLTNKEIAMRLTISENTVKAFLRLIMAKMEMTTRSGVVGKIIGSNGHGKERPSANTNAVADPQWRVDPDDLLLSAVNPGTRFNHRRRASGEIDSICARCFQKVATAGSESELRQEELFHQCDSQ